MRMLRVVDAERLYEQDFFAWTRAQARELRRMRQTRSNTPLDLRNLIDEVLGVGSDQRLAVRSQVTRIIEHLLKLDHSPATAPRLGWMRSIDSARNELADRLSRSLRRDVERHLGRLYGRARREAMLALLEHGEVEAAKALPEHCPYALDEVLREEWYSTVQPPELSGN